MLQRLNKRKGYTLINLILASILIGIIATIVFEIHDQVRDKSKIIIKEKIIVEKPSFVPKIKETAKQKEGMTKL